MSEIPAGSSGSSSSTEAGTSTQAAQSATSIGDNQALSTNDRQDKAVFLKRHRKSHRSKKIVQFNYPQSMSFKPNKNIEQGKVELNFTIPQKILHIIAGPQKVDYGIQECFLRHYSPYFETALSGPWKESSLHTIELPDRDPAIVGLFVDWCITQDIRETVCSDMILSSFEREKQETPSFGQLFDLWLLADYFRIPDLQNQTISVLMAKNIRLSVIPIDTVGERYDEFSLGSPLRRLLVYWCVHGRLRPSWYNKCPEKFSKTMLLDIAEAFALDYEKGSESTERVPPTPEDFFVNIAGNQAP